NKDFVELKQLGKLAVATTPIGNGIGYIGMNCKNPPFNNLKVRQAGAYAIPYHKIMDAVMFGFAVPLYGAQADAPIEGTWRQPHTYTTDPTKAKQLPAEGGRPGGCATACWFDRGLGAVNEPLCVLVQESLAQIGIQTTINKVPGANWRNELLKKEMPL